MGVLDQVPILYVSIDGQQAPRDLTRRVLSLEIEEGEEKGKALATHLKLVLDDADDTMRELLPHGTVLGVRWGYPGTLSTPRAGVVHVCTPNYQDATVSVEAFGKELALSRGAIRHTFRSQTFREAAEEITTRAGLSLRFEAEDTIRFEGQIVDDESAWSWITRRSAELGLSVEMEGDVVVVREPALDAPPGLVLLYGWRNANVLSFELKEDTKRSQTESEGVVALFHDPASGQTFTHAAGDPNTTRRTLAARRLAAERSRALAAERAGVAAFVEAHPDLADASPEAQRSAWEAERDRRRSNNIPASQDDGAFLVVSTESGEVLASEQAPTAEVRGGPQTGRAVGVAGENSNAVRAHAERIAQGLYRAHERTKITASVKALGLPAARRGMVAKVLGVNTRDGGLWYVTSCRHTIDASGYETELELSREGVNAGARNRRHGGVANPVPTQGQAGSSSASPQTTAAPVVVDLEA